ncbi:MAG: hypothetical protein JRI69_11705 [Deltaproteobacteria bacterium]|nr:hypothetical protein [Deltaproteobacteria bacterium]
MTQITLRGMDPEIEKKKKIRQTSRMTGKSLNRVILDMIYNYTGLNKKRRTPSAASLTKLAGGWSEKEASKFFESLKSCEQIDEEMWK